MSTTPILLTESDRGPAERLLDVVLGSSAHLWHNRPGIDVGGVWQPAAPHAARSQRRRQRRRACSCRRRSTSTASCSTSTSSTPT